MAGFMDTIGRLGDSALDLGVDYARQELIKPEVVAIKNPAPAGQQTADAGLTRSGQVADSISLGGLSLNRTALYVVGGALLGILFLKAVR